MLSFKLYHIPAEAAVYPSLLCAFIGIIFFLAGFILAKKKHRILNKVNKFTDSLSSMPKISTVEDEDYQKIIRTLNSEKSSIEESAARSYADMTDYFTVWAHQIKTPISSMKLTLSDEDTELSRNLSSDLFRIEQYVEMVLAYLRLGSDSTDYVIKEYSLDSILRRSVKKFAGEFIHRKIRLEYTPPDKTVITDEKWLSFVIEQIISNSLKYTPEGCIKIYMKDSCTLCIEDTGIGIDKDDLPRIFEKGYTGKNGRNDLKASGLGLYLCRRVCKNLGLKIYADSCPSKGTSVFICLNGDVTKM